MASTSVKSSWFHEWDADLSETRTPLMFLRTATVEHSPEKGLLVADIGELINTFFFTDVQDEAKWRQGPWNYKDARSAFSKHPYGLDGEDPSAPVMRVQDSFIHQSSNTGIFYVGVSGITPANTLFTREGLYAVRINEMGVMEVGLLCAGMQQAPINDKSPAYTRADYLWNAMPGNLELHSSAGRVFLLGYRPRDGRDISPRLASAIPDRRYPINDETLPYIFGDKESLHFNEIHQKTFTLKIKPEGTC